MSQLRFLEKLLDGASVEWKALSEVGELVRGNGLPKTDFTEYGVPAIHYGQIYTYYGLSTASTKSFVSPETAEKLKKVNAGDVVITNTSENLEDVGKALVYLGQQQAVTGGHATIFKSNKIMLGKYFAYCTQTNFFADEKRKYAKGTKVIDISTTDMAKIRIPIPPLPVQVEIVRILDAFTELTAELTARKKQYNYYRDQLLSFEEGKVEWKTLGETLVRTKGTNITAGQMKELDKFGAPLKVFAGGRTVAFVNFEDIPAKDVNREPSIIVKSRGVIEFEYYDKPFSHKNEMWSYHSKNDAVDIKFVYYFLRMNEPYFQNLGSKMQMPQIATPDTDKFQIPIPPLAEQKRIVAILDKFDALTSSISEGLPREIELRQKQYEYYRELLLSFPKPDGTK
ncbi:restriction endonuclease subunit S [Leptospira santarosai]|uniref:restriction endonuclease subunit S n=1 Tax=Leptospira santarosai TaxID=28183 RepID=UPI0024AE9EE8|nr:restriction endonuclease subunit S [Leptospira santarosai]MDI7201639.1 restriction endonuclease subunit S [Leptospira santarosai]